MFGLWENTRPFMQVAKTELTLELYGIFHWNLLATGYSALGEVSRLAAGDGWSYFLKILLV